MSLDGQRDAYIREKKNEIANCDRSRRRKLRELYRYTCLLNAGLPPQVPDCTVSEDPDEIEARFLDENDIGQGRRFNDATLPLPILRAGQHAQLPPTLPFQSPAKPNFPTFPKSSPSPVVGPSLEEQLRTASASPAVAAPPLPSVETSAQNDATAIASPAKAIHSEVPSPVRTPMVEEEVVTKSPLEAQQSVNFGSSAASPTRDVEMQEEAAPDGPSVDPKDTAPPAAEDTAALQDTSTPTNDIVESPKKPQVVHLPPKDVQEARLKETERKLDKVAERERKENERLAIPNANAPADLVSSPSSTVGPYSQATPHAPHRSPDTSPETEAFHDQTSTPAQNGAAVDPSAQQVKDDHERALQIQMQEARERARADSSPTPEVQRQIEDEQAVRLARDGKNRLSESQPAPGPQALTELAEDVAQDAEPEAPVAKVNRSQEPAAESLPTPTTTAPEPTTGETEGADNAFSKPLRPSLSASDHPTPPADTDVEMDEVPCSAKEQQQEVSQSTPPRADRMTTRVSSGAIRQKSVSEIIAEKAAPKAVLTPGSSNLSVSASPARPHSHQKKSREISAVVFSKQDPNRATKALQSYNPDYASLRGASQDSGRDYLEGLFRYQAHHPPRSAPLQDLVTTARKTLSTAGTLAMMREQQDYKILKRVYQLQNANRWSLRQLQKSAEPERPLTHQDNLIAEMKWLQTDFKEERKWKKSLAATFAGWCAQYVNSSPQQRVALRVNARIPKPRDLLENGDEDMEDAPTPDLVQSGPNETENESFADDEELPLDSNPPAAVFSLGFNDVVMKINRTPASDTMFQELPLYEPMLEGSSDVSPLSFCDPPILPVSKFVTGKLVSQVKGPPRKRSRYDYDSEDEPSTPPSRSGTSAEHSMPSTPGRRLYHRNDLPAERSDIALFNPENKHIRDRLQAAHHFRPPTEFQMPTVQFFENRTSSQWLWDEDQKLRGLVREYTFNWSLVAQQLNLPSQFTAGSGRRTPWECFERWVQLEGLPAEMSKTQYFRTYQTRLEQAQRTVTAQHQAQQQLMQQQAQQGQTVSGQPRRRTTQPIRVERRRENRHLAIIESMRKLARKRESQQHKQRDSANAAALRKAQEINPPKREIVSPQEFSRLRWEREEKLRTKIQQQQQQQHDMNAHARQQQLAAHRQAQMQAQMTNGMNPQQRNAMAGANPNAPTHMGNSSSQQGQNAAAMSARAQQGMQTNFPNGNSSSMPMGNPDVPQAQMQASIPSSQNMLPEQQQQMRIAMQRGQFGNANQHQVQLQQQQINMASNVAQMGMNGLPIANMIASMSNGNMSGNVNGNLNGGMNGHMNGHMNGNINGNVSGNMNGNMNRSMNAMSNNAGSPQMNQMNHNMQSPARPLSSGHMPQLYQISNQLKKQYPDWSQEQINKAANNQLHQYMAKQRSQAMTAAAGSSGMNQSPQIGNNHYLQNSGGMANSPSPNAVQNYQQQLVQQQRLMSQQAHRQNVSSPGMNQRPLSRSATPQNHNMQQSPSLQQAQTNRSG